MSVGRAVYERIVAVTSTGSVYDDVDGRIYQASVPDDAALPLLVITVISETPISRFGSDGLEADVQIDLYANRFVTGAGLALLATRDTLYSLLHRTAITPSGWGPGEIRCTDRGGPVVEEDSIRIQTAWAVRAT